jgi:hypothetical protein
MVSAASYAARLHVHICMFYPVHSQVLKMSLFILLLVCVFGEFASVIIGYLLCLTHFLYRPVVSLIVFRMIALFNLCHYQRGIDLLSAMILKII